ncbi:MAG TPA: GNAT family N-acetyltransferase [Acidimicrobiales bacterium]|nr:GNAT family N-acetyltransferase [Acidimicrobiales bacterium]
MTADARLVEEVSALDDALCASLAALVPQLSKSADPLTRAVLEEIVASSATTLFVAKDPSGGVVGMLTLATFRAPTGVRAWIEDVVVDTTERHRGTGAALVRAALAKADAVGARTVDLTSNPARTEANALYRKLGFNSRETNVYRFEPS